MTTLEKVARAICCPEGKCYAVQMNRMLTRTEQKCHVDGMDIAKARAAIEALREPSDEALEAASVFIAGSVQPKSIVRLQSLIDYILAEKPDD